MNFKCGKEKDCPYRKKAEELEEKLAYTKFELEQLRDKRYRKNSRKPVDEDNIGKKKKKPKKRGGLFGHAGWFRKKPKKIDITEEVKIEKCPDCGYKDLKECREIEEHIQEDIVLPQVRTTLYKRYHYYCKRCGKVVAGRGEGELSRSYIGPVAKTLAVFMKYDIKISDRDIRKLFEKVFNLKIVASSIVGFRNQLKREAAPLYGKLLEALRKGSFIHADETGWKIDGKNYWLWKFSNKNICVSHIDKGRGQKVVEEILGKEYDGVLISDFLSAYNRIVTKAKQRCLVHLLRDLKKVVKYWKDNNEVLRYCKRLREILEDAMSLHKEYKGKDRDKRFCERREIIVKSLADFSFPDPSKRILQRFANRLKRHKNEIFTFLYEEGIDYHNNHAEQQIRPDVIFRKITFGNRSSAGAEVHKVLVSILQTAKLNQLNPIKVFEKILLAQDKNRLINLVVPP